MSIVSNHSPETIEALNQFDEFGGPLEQAPWFGPPEDDWRDYELFCRRLETGVQAAKDLLSWVKSKAEDEERERDAGSGWSRYYYHGSACSLADVRGRLQKVVDLMEGR